MTNDGERQEAGASVSEDTKAKFREALDRKNAAHRPASDGEGKQSSVHGSETVGPVQRTFRRKSG